MSTNKIIFMSQDISDFAKLKESGCYFVDKTLALKTIIDIDLAKVMLFTRPTGFGKTMFLSMIESFLRIDSANPGNSSLQQELFKGTKILEDRNFCNKYMGQHPVIYLNFKTFKGDTIEEAYLNLAQIIVNKANEYSFLKDSPFLGKNDKRELEKLTDKNFLVRLDALSRSYVTSSIIDLGRMLYKHFKKQVYVLIDDYDVPFAVSKEKGYHDDLVLLISSLYDFFKTTPQDPTTYKTYVGRIFLTGCLKEAQSSVSDIINNIYDNSITDRLCEYTGIIGFTSDDINQLLKDNGLEDLALKIKENCGGYRFYDKEMYRPKSVINFIEGKNKSVSNRSISNSKSELSDYIGYLAEHDRQNLNDLIEGKSISFYLYEYILFTDMSFRKSHCIWSLLLQKGYLTIDWDKTEYVSRGFNCSIYAKLPNLEMKKFFTDNMKVEPV